MRSLINTGMQRSVGFVLPLTLIILALLTALSFGLSRMVSERMQDLQARKTQWSEEKQVRDALEESALVLLLGRYDQQSVNYEGQKIPLNNLSTTVNDLTLSAQSWSGLYSLSLLGEANAVGVLEQMMDKEKAQTVGAELGDWIDENNRRRFRGKETADYISERMSQSPRNAPLRTIDEFLELPSVDPAMMNGIDGRPGIRDIFLAGGEDNFDLGTAPEILIGPVLGLDKNRVREIVEARNEQDWSKVRFLIDENYWVFNDHPVFYKGLKYRFVFEGKNGLKARAQVELTPFDPNGLFSIIDWQVPDYIYE